MAIAFGSVSSVAFAARTNTTVTPPTGIANGDTLIALAMTVGASDAPVITPPAGWTQISVTHSYAGPGAFSRCYAFKKIASGESGNYTFTHGAADIGSSASILRYTGSNGTVNAVSTNAGSPANTTRTATSITTTVNDCMLLYLGWDFSDTGTETPPTGMTERLDVAPLYAADVLFPTAGATGNKTNTCNSASGSPRGAWLVALEPSGAGSQAITGALYADTDSVYGSAVGAQYSVAGALYADQDTLRSSSVVASYAVSGAQHQNTNSFYGAAASSAFAVLGFALSDSDGFHAGTVSATFGVGAAPFSDADEFFAAAIDNGATSSTILGALFTNDSEIPSSIVSAAYFVVGELAEEAGDVIYASSSSGSYGIASGFLASSVEFYNAVHTSEYVLSASTVVDAEVFYSASLSGDQTIVCVEFVGSNTFFVTLVSGDWRIRTLPRSHTNGAQRYARDSAPSASRPSVNSGVRPRQVQEQRWRLN